MRPTPEFFDPYTFSQIRCDLRPADWPAFRAAIDLIGPINPASRVTSRDAARESREFRTALGLRRVAADAVFFTRQSVKAFLFGCVCAKFRTLECGAIPPNGQV